MFTQAETCGLCQWVFAMLGQIKAILQLHELGNRCQRRVNLIYTASATTVEKCQAHSENTSETCHGIEIAQAHLSIL
jgi:hypothetical protein